MSVPRTADVAVVGGGVVGCSIAYHLARQGAGRVVVLERESVGSGTTSKAAGGIRAQFPTETEIRFSLEAIRVFERFEDEYAAFCRVGHCIGVGNGTDAIELALRARRDADLRAFARHLERYRTAYTAPTSGHQCHEPIEPAHGTSPGLRAARSRRPRRSRPLHRISTGRRP